MSAVITVVVAGVVTTIITTMKVDVLGAVRATGAGIAGIGDPSSIGLGACWWSL
jgi:hypothetical protein